MKVKTSGLQREGEFQEYGVSWIFVLQNADGSTEDEL